jgi:hypothetical protein
MFAAFYGEAAKLEKPGNMIVAEAAQWLNQGDRCMDNALTLQERKEAARQKGWEQDKRERVGKYRSFHPPCPPRQSTHLMRSSLSQSTAKATTPASPASAKSSASQSEPWKRRRRLRIAKRERTCWRAAGDDGVEVGRGEDG